MKRHEVTDEQWEVIQPILHKRCPSGKPAWRGAFDLLA